MLTNLGLLFHLFTPSLYFLIIPSGYAKTFLSFIVLSVEWGGETRYMYSGMILGFRPANESKYYL